jgi:transaldolase
MNKGPLYEMTVTSPTEFWNDSCAAAELSDAISYGATGGTSNPTIAGQVLKKELETWKPKIAELVKDNPTATEDVIAWKTIEAITVNAAKLLKPIYDKNKGRNGRLSIQTNTKFCRDAKAIVEQAVYFDSLYPNNNIKLPVTKAGIEAVEELSYRGISVNATASFTVPQGIAVAEAVERGIERREKDGKDVSRMSPVCTIMAGRLDDWLKVVASKKVLLPTRGIWNGPGWRRLKKHTAFTKNGYTGLGCLLPPTAIIFTGHSLSAAICP